MHLMTSRWRTHGLVMIGLLRRDRRRYSRRSLCRAGDSNLRQVLLIMHTMRLLVPRPGSSSFDARGKLLAVPLPVILLLGLLLLGMWQAESAARANEPAFGGNGRGEGCITVVMPCQPGFVADPRCAARARSRLPPPTPSGACTIVGLTARGLSDEARDSLRSRIEKEILPEVCSCYEEGLSIRRSLRGRVSVRVRMKDGCGVVEPGGDSLPDPFTTACVRTRFDGFSASSRTNQAPSPSSPPDRLAEQMKQQSFVVQIDLRLRPSPGSDSRPRQADRCDPLPREHMPCTQEHAVCVITHGKPGGWSSALWCRGGQWVIENERNVP